jgi:hypothetical protein
MAYVLMARDRCTPSSCAAFRALADHHQIVANMDERVYENLVTRYAPSWNAPPQAASGLLAGLPTSVPTGKPTNAEFPTAASTPAVSIMTPEPPLGAAPKPPPAAPRPAPAAAATQPAQAAAKKPPPAPKRAPVQLAPTAAAPTADSNE